MKSADEYSDDDATRRMEAALKRALTTRHKPLKKFVGKSSVTGKRSVSRPRTARAKAKESA